MTAGYLAVTVLTAALGNAAKLGLSGLLLAVVQAALVEAEHRVLVSSLSDLTDRRTP